MLFTWNDSQFVKICLVFDSCQIEYDKNVSFFAQLLYWLIDKQSAN